MRNNTLLAQLLPMRAHPLGAPEPTGLRQRSVLPVLCPPFSGGVTVSHCVFERDPSHCMAFLICTERAPLPEGASAVITRGLFCVQDFVVALGKWTRAALVGLVGLRGFL